MLQIYMQRRKKFQMSGYKNENVYIASILLMPFFMFSWMIPFISSLTLGNDYQIHAIQEQMELMFSLRTGTFPLFIPGFGGGQNSIALTQGQLFHPISHIAAILPGYWAGKALEWNTFLRVFSLGVAHVFLFKFLRNLRLNPIVSLVLSTITVYNLRMLDLFRYGASFESWTGFLFLCSSIGLYYLKPTKLKGPLAIVVSTYLIICSGHPQMVYYGLIGASIFTIVIPFYIRTIVPCKEDLEIKLSHFWSGTGISFLLGILLSSAYIIPFYFDFLKSNSGRIDMGYRFANSHLDTFIGTINNFFQPLCSDVHGVFGGSSLFLIPAIIPLLKMFRVKLPRIIWIIWGILLIVFLHMQGERLPVHYYIWKYIPLASSIRIAGRISIVLPVFLMLLLAWVVQHDFTFQMHIFKKKRISFQTVLSVIALFMMVAYLLVPESITKNNTMYWATSIRQVPSYIEWIVYALGMMSLIILFFHGNLRNKNPSIGILLFLVVCIQILFYLPFGTWVEKKNETPSFTKMLTLKKGGLTYYGWPAYGMTTKTISVHAKETFLEPFIGKVYQKYRIAKNNKDAYAIMRKGRTPDEVIIEKYQPGQCLLSKGLANISYSKSFAEIYYASFNRLAFDIHAANPGFFVLAYPYTKNWKANVNNSKSHVFRGNGAYMAVCIPSGKSKIEFRYFSYAMVAGMLVSCLTFLFITVTISAFCLKKPLNIFPIIICIALSSGIFILWYSSLYTGKNLNTKYQWYSKASITPPNIAYGKKTLLSSVNFNEYGHLNSGGKAVDGDYIPGSGFRTSFQKKPSLTIQLSKAERIGSVHIFGALKGKFVNNNPLEVRFALNPDKWAHIASKKLDKVIQIELERPIRARYVQIRAHGNCILALDEVEIFPPKK